MQESQGPRAAQTVRSYARWVARAKPGDFVIALGAASASVPLVGRHLETMSGFAALGVGGRRYVTSIAAGMTQARFKRGRAEQRQTDQALTPGVLTDALETVIAAEQLAQPWPSHREIAPLWKAAGQRRYVFRSSVRYGDHPSQVLDVWRSEDDGTPKKPAPVLVFLPGGAWVFGSRALQGHALMSHLARRGWVCLSVQYRTSPRHRWPRQMTDVKSAVAWARANAQRFGGDPNFVAVAGCSAGGHLASLAGLTANDPQWQTTPDADTSVDAVVSVYGTYDWLDRSTKERDRFVEFLERVVVKRPHARHPEVFRAASPIERVHSLAPPFLVVHGSDDRLIPVGEARAFVERLRSVSASTVSYVELPGVGHGFDLIDGARTAPVVAAIGRFLHQVHQNRMHAAVTSAV